MMKASIIGGGIAGPVAAMAVQPAGITPVIYEAYPRSAEDAGLFLTLATNGIHALSLMDLHKLVAGQGFPTPRIILASGSGKELADVRLGSPLPDGTESQTISRSALYRVLRDEAVRGGVQIEYGKRLTDARALAGGGVVAEFEDGSEAEGDLLIGCDGVHSKTRQMIDRDARAPRHVELINLGGHATSPDLSIEPGTWTMIFGKRAFFGYAARSSGEFVWFANVPSPEEPDRRELASITTSQWKERLTDLFKDDRSPAVRLVQATNHELRASNTYDLSTCPRGIATA